MPPVVLAVAEVADGALTRFSTEVATLARQLADASGGTAVGLVVDTQPCRLRQESSRPICRGSSPSPRRMLETRVPAPHVPAEVRRLVDEGVTHVLLAASTDGRDVAGTLVGLLGWGYLANVESGSWEGDGRS